MTLPGTALPLPRSPIFLMAALLLLAGCGSAIDADGDRDNGPAIGEETPAPGRTLHPIVIATISGTLSAAGDRSAGDGDRSGELLESMAQAPEPGYVSLNGVALEDLLVVPPTIRENVREIFRRGRQLGRDPRAFSKLGASVVDTQHFMGRFDYGPYVLGEYENLQAAIDHYRGSFERDSIATVRGMSARTAFDPVWADKALCQPNESALDCELRLYNPSVLLIALGTNDIDTAANFEEQFRAVIEHTMNNGVVPVVATKADRFEGPDNRNNNVMRRLAQEYAVPLWDFDLLAETLPGRGISGDDVHLTIFDEYDYTLPEAHERGYGMFNLSALMMLEALRQEYVTIEIEDPQ